MEKLRKLFSKPVEKHSVSALPSATADSVGHRVDGGAEAKNVAGKRNIFDVDFYISIAIIFGLIAVIFSGFIYY